jgi:DNA-binding NtrC family response regulator
MTEDLLNYKRILVVDDEPDVLETLEEILSMCEVVKASTFEDAKALLEREYFDIAVLDIMGVDGYALLDIANRRGISAVMLTAHALSPEDTAKSYKEGAASYVPKEKVSEMTSVLNDVLQAKEEGKSTWSQWFDRFAAYYDKKFGPRWKEKTQRLMEDIGVWE